MRQSLAYDEDVGEFSPPSATNENLTCDFLVAGGGLSGLSAADAAIRRGLNVVVIEKGVYGKEAASGLSAPRYSSMRPMRASTVRECGRLIWTYRSYGSGIPGQYRSV